MLEMPAVKRSGARVFDHVMRMGAADALSAP